MDSKEIVRKLIVGSETIDRMKREIDSTVKAVVGLVNFFYDARASNIGRFPSLRGTWYIWRRSGHELKVEYLFEGSRVGYSTLLCVGKDINLRDVSDVHQDLPIFIEGMVKMFPYLTKNWQPILDAADYAERNGWKF
ncbi:MAG: hypothetical protein HYT62_01290 [Candidatus Yanofskybacteria bacterium]|nr:hypothetical protein [Candidatus Yanofskybacteria bacterium]